MLACASGAVDPLGRLSIRCQSQSRLLLAHPAGPLALLPALPALPAVRLAPLLHSHSRHNSGRNNGLGHQVAKFRQCHSCGGLSDGRHSVVQVICSRRFRSD